MKVKEPQWLQSGGNILKMADGDQLPAPYNNITFAEGAGRWYSDVGGKYFNNILQLIAQSPNLQATIDAINQMQDRHYGLYTTSNGVQPKVNINQNVNDYQSDINSGYEFVNTVGIQQGRDNNRYVNPDKGATKDKPVNTVWGEDQHYGAQTDDRRLLGRITNGTDDYTTEELSSLQEQLGKYGVEMYLDPNTNYYKLKLNGKGITTTNRGIPPTELTFTKEDKPKLPNPHILPHIATLGVGLINNSIQNLKQKQLEFPLHQPDYRQYQRSSEYYPRTLLEKQATETRWQGTQNLTSDINQNLRIRGAAEKSAEEYAIKAAQMMSDQYRYDTQMAKADRDYNIAKGTEIRNYNTDQIAKSKNNRIIADQQKAERNTAGINEFIRNISGEILQSNQTNKLNEQYRKYGNYALQNNMEKRRLYDTFSRISNDISQWSEFGGLYDAAMNSTDFMTKYIDKKSEPLYATRFANTNGKITTAQRDQLLNWMQNSDDPNAVKYRTNYKNFLEKLQNSFYNKLYNLEEKKEAWKLANVPQYVTNEFDWNFTPQDRTSLMFKKSGGKIDKLSDYTKQYSKELQHVRTSIDKRNKTALQHLDKQLDRLNREQLLLLRSVFK